MMQYIKIYNWMLQGLNLRGNELLVYAYLYMWHESGRDIYLRNWQIAKELAMPAETFSRIVKRLQQEGLLNGLEIDKTSRKIDKTSRRKLTKRQDEIDETSRRKLTKRQDEIDETSIPHIYKNIKENNKEKEENACAREAALDENVEEVEVVSVPFPETSMETSMETRTETRRQEIILQGIVDQYQRRGEIYVPNYATQTTAALSLRLKVEQVMQHYGIVDTEENFGNTWRRILEAGYTNGDQFQREHWTLDYIDKQFMVIFNNLKNGNKANSKSRKGQSGVSADYVQRLMLTAGIAL